MQVFYWRMPVLSHGDTGEGFSRAGFWRRFLQRKAEADGDSTGVRVLGGAGELIIVKAAEALGIALFRELGADGSFSEKPPGVVEP